MSGEISITPGYVFDEINGETMTLAKLNQLIGSMVAQIDAGAVGTRELADGSITADKLDADISAQLGIPDGSITTLKLADGALSADATGRAKMEDGYITTAKVEDAFLSADAAGRAKMEDGYFDEATMQAKFAADVLSANAGGRALMEDGFVTHDKLETRAGMPTGAESFQLWAYPTAVQSPAPGGYVTIDMVAHWDLGGVWTDGNDRYTPGVLGYYLFAGRVQLENVAVGTFVRSAIAHNGTVRIWGNVQKSGYIDDVGSVVVGIIRAIDPADYFQLQVLHDNTGARAVTNLYPGITYMQAALIATF